MATVQHVVLVKFRPEAPAGLMAEVVAAIDALKPKLPGLVEVSGGANNSPEGLAKGFTHGFVVTFVDRATRDAYLEHPDHEPIKQQLLGWLDGGVDGVLVVDWGG